MLSYRQNACSCRASDAENDFESLINVLFEGPSAEPPTNEGPNFAITSYNCAGSVAGSNLVLTEIYLTGVSRSIGSLLITRQIPFWFQGFMSGIYKDSFHLAYSALILFYPLPLRDRLFLEICRKISPVGSPILSFLSLSLRCQAVRHMCLVSSLQIGYTALCNREVPLYHKQRLIIFAVSLLARHDLFIAMSVDGTDFPTKRLRNLFFTSSGERKCCVASIVLRLSSYIAIREFGNRCCLI